MMKNYEDMDAGEDPRVQREDINSLAEEYMLRTDIGREMIIEDINLITAGSIDKVPAEHFH